MAVLTINYPNLPLGKPVTVPGVTGAMVNGSKYEVGNEIPEDIVLGEPLSEDTPLSNVEKEVKPEEIIEPQDNQDGEE